MDRDAIKEVLRDVFGNVLGAKDVGGWVSIRCPVSTYTHARGTDNTPSAGVSVHPSGSSIFRCFTCDPIGRPFHAMLSQYANFSGEDLGDLIEELEEEEYLGPRSLPSWENLKGGNETAQQMPLDESIFMDLYDSAAGHPYLLGRGISAATATKLELMFDPKDPADKEPRILFPIRGADGLLYGFSGRAIRPNAKLKVRDYHGMHKALNVLGAHLVSRDNPDKVLLVEGLVDYASAHECGYYGCALMHASMTDAQAAIMRDLGKPTYLFLDNPEIDDAGARGIEIAGKKLERYLPVMRVRYPNVMIEDDSEEGAHLVKDPGELLKEEIEAMIADARLF